MQILCFDFYRPLKRDQDIGSDTDFTQSSMEDLSVRYSKRQEEATICDHRTQEQKHYRAGNSQPRRPTQRRVLWPVTYITRVYQSFIHSFIHPSSENVVQHDFILKFKSQGSSNQSEHALMILFLPQLHLEDGREMPCLLLSSVLLSRSGHFILRMLLLYHWISLPSFLCKWGQYYILLYIIH